MISIPGLTRSFLFLHCRQALEGLPRYPTDWWGVKIRVLPSFLRPTHQSVGYHDHTLSHSAALSPEYALADIYIKTVHEADLQSGLYDLSGLQPGIFQNSTNPERVGVPELSKRLKLYASLTQRSKTQRGKQNAQWVPLHKQRYLLFLKPTKGDNIQV